MLRATLKTLQKYLLRQVIASLLLTVAVFTFVLLLGNALKEILPLLMNRQASLGMIARAFALLIPFVWVFALPMGMLTATLLVFGRFSADQELTAARASGVSLVSLILPILSMSLLLCAVSAIVNLYVAPRCRVAYNDLRGDLKEALANVRLPEGRLVRDVPGYVIYVGKNRKQKLQDVFVYRLEGKTNPPTTMQAPRGELQFDKTNEQLVLTLYDVNSTTVYGTRSISGFSGEMALRIDLGDDTSKGPGKPSISNMTFWQLLDELADAERSMTRPVSMEKLSDLDTRARKREMKKQLSDLTTPVRVQIHRQVAASFACFGFTLIGIPLGIRMHRRETNIGVAIALGLVLIYYALIIIGESLSNQPELAPHLWMWLPNFVFQAVGAVLLWRANKG